MTRLPPTVRWAGLAGSGGVARRHVAGRHRAFRRMEKRLEPIARAGPRLSPLARANFWRCRHGAPAISRRRASYIDLIAADGETPPGTRQRIEFCRR